MAKTDTINTVQNVLKRSANKPITLEKVSPILKRSLLPQEMVLFLRDTIRKRNEGNNRVTGKETIKLIGDLGGAYSVKQAGSHLDYFIRMGRFYKMKSNGRILASQGTTTDRSQIPIARKYL